MKRHSRGVGLALAVASLVAVSGCGAAGGPLIGGIIGALGLLLGLAGCATSHSNQPPLPPECAEGESSGACAEDNDDDGYVAGLDCNDNDPSVHPGAEEICQDDVDQDCDGEDCFISTNTCTDADGDSYGEGFCADSDCDDENADVHPGAEEICDDGIDQDCDGEDCYIAINPFCEDIDADGDGHYSLASEAPEFCGEDDCNDENASVYPGAEEICNDGVDQNCDGEDCEIEVNTCTDADFDGYGVGFCAEQDCNDSDVNTHPAAADDCGDGIDTNCDGEDGVAGECFILNGMLDVETDEKMA